MKSCVEQPQKIVFAAAVADGDEDDDATAVTADGGDGDDGGSSWHLNVLSVDHDSGCH